jgi:hypothetical protein
MFQPLGHLQRLNRCYRICCCILHMSNVSLQGCRRVRTKIYIHVISKQSNLKNIFTYKMSVYFSSNPTTTLQRHVGHVQNVTADPVTPIQPLKMA